MRLVLVLVLPGVAHATTVAVCSSGCAYSDVQTAVDNTATGDTIEVGPGSYTGSVTLNHRVSLVGTGGSGVTTLVGDAALRPVLDIAAGGTTVSGFSLDLGSSRRAVEVDGATGVTLTDLSVQGPYTRNVDGVGLVVRGPSTVTLEDSAFFDLTAEDGVGFGGSGGAISVEQADLTVLHTTLESDTSYRGGAVWCGPGGSLVLDNTELRDNTAVEDTGLSFLSGYGGAVAAIGCSVTLTDAIVDGNHADQGGGGVAAGFDGAADTYHLVIDDSQLLDNTSDSKGGGVFALATIVSLDGTDVVGNTAIDSGGGIASESTGSLSLKGVVVQGNSSMTRGGGVYVGGQDSWAEDLVLKDNLADLGGGMYVESPTSQATWTRVLSCRNSSTTQGGGLYLAHAHAELEQVAFLGDDGGSAGGALYATGSDVSVFYGAFLAGTADAGGDIYLLNTPALAANTLIGWSSSEGVRSAGSSSFAPSRVAWMDNPGGHLVPGGVTGAANLVVSTSDAMLYRTPTDLPCDWLAMHPSSVLRDAGESGGTDTDFDGTTVDIGPHGGPYSPGAPWRDEDGDLELWVYDCDDTSASVHPLADEVCSGVDDDCDGLIDDADDSLTGGTVWYLDADGDGVGTADTQQVACDPGDGWADVDGDCAPNDADIHPWADEVWYDGVDQNCDGASDFDQDADGAEVDVDCDDTDPSIRPGAEEVWYDGVDQDCDGASDFDQDADGAEVDVDCDDTDPSIRPGAADIPGDSVDQDCDGYEPSGEVRSGGCAHGSGRGIGWFLFLAPLWIRRRSSRGSTAA